MFVSELADILAPSYDVADILLTTQIKIHTVAKVNVQGPLLLTRFNFIPSMDK